MRQLEDHNNCFLAKQIGCMVWSKSDEVGFSSGFRHYDISITTTGSGRMTVTILIVDLAWSSLWVDKFYQFLSFLLLCEVRLGLMKKKRYGDVENFRPEIENTV